MGLRTPQGAETRSRVICWICRRIEFANPTRSASAIAQASTAAADEIAAGRMSVRHVAGEEFVLQADEEPYDLVFAVRVGALDGRHPKVGERALQRIAMATTDGARLFVDGGDPLRELPIPKS